MALENNYIKDLFIKKRYKEVIEALEDEFKLLYVRMLEYKKDEVKEEYTVDMSFEDLSILVSDYYPRYLSENNVLTNVKYDEEGTELDVINLMLSEYKYFSETYKEAYDEPDYNADDDMLDELDDIE